MQKKLGPLKLWQWAAIGVALGLAIYIYEAHKQNQAASPQSSTDPTKQTPQPPALRYVRNPAIQWRTRWRTRTVYRNRPQPRVHHHHHGNHRKTRNAPAERAPDQAPGHILYHHPNGDTVASSSAAHSQYQQESVRAPQHRRFPTMTHPSEPSQDPHPANGNAYDPPYA